MMDIRTIQEMRRLVEQKLASSVGQRWLHTTEAQLLEACGRQSFNTERAVQMYTIVIERVAIGDLRGLAVKAYLTALREHGLISDLATELVEQFKTTTGAFDQRPARKGLWAAFVGK